MVQIIAENRKRTFGENFGEAISGGINAYAQFRGQQNQKEQQAQNYQQENEAVKRLIGKDLTGIRDPKIRQSYIDMALQAETKKSEQERKFAHELDKQSKEHEFLGQQPKTPPGGHGAQPLNPEVASNIEKIIKENPDVNATDLEIAFQKGGVPKSDYTGFIESKRRQEDTQSNLKNKKVEMGYSRDNDVLKEAEKIRQMIPTEEASLDAMKDAILSGDQSFFSPNNIAEKTGLELFRNASGGQMKTALKTFLINNVSKFGSRPNMYIEQQMADALAKVGRSRAANIMSYEMVKFDSDIKKQMLSQMDELSEQDINPGSLGKNVQKNMKEFVDERQKDLVEKMKFIKNHEKEIDETPKDHIPMIDPEGNLVYIPNEKIDEAKFHGAFEL